MPIRPSDMRRDTNQLTPEMQTTSPAWQQFEVLVERILTTQNFRITPHFPQGNLGFDFDGRLGNEQWAIEVKYYRTARAQPNLIDAGAARVASNGVMAQTKKGMLIVSCVLPAPLRAVLEERFSVTFVDRVDLASMASGTPTLASELDSLLELDPDASPASPAMQDPLTSTRQLEAAARREPDTRGTDLCDSLKMLKRGKVAWADYERLSADILKYLFPNDLQGWHAQKRTDDGLNRFDFICRIRPVTDFWKFLIDHLDSRYVLFEFKNYTGKIKQGKILTTEKYLLGRGLRRVAIILTRAVAEPQALAMAQGAMREHGKLMLIVNDDKLCEMLHMKERGEDPSDALFDLSDDFLLSLPR